MVVPAGRTVQLCLESPDVIHAFYVPQFLFKRDVVPGRVNVFEFTSTSRRRPDLPRPVRRAVRRRPPAHAVRRPRVCARRLRRLAPGQDRRGQRLAAARAIRGPVGWRRQVNPAAGRALAVSALNIAFEPTALQAPADTPFKIEFDNKDASVPHNVAIHEGGPTGPEVFQGRDLPGPAKKTYDVPPLPAGTYGFICTVHPNMTGTLTVQ